MNCALMDKDVEGKRKFNSHADFVKSCWCVNLVLWRVLILTIRPSMMPKLSLMTLARGARQLVVQEALLWRN